MPSRWLSSRVPQKAGSVPCPRATSNCSEVNCLRHSASVFFTRGTATGAPSEPFGPINRTVTRALEDDSSAFAIPDNKEPPARILNAKKRRLVCNVKSCLILFFLNFPTRCTAILTLAAIFGSLASALSFAGVLTFAAVVTGLATALSFARILALAAMFPFVLVRQAVQGREGCSGDAHSGRP